MAQHLGSPAEPVVAPGDKVLVGSVIGRPSGFLSAFVHSPYSGTVESVGPYADLSGNMVTHVAIRVEGDTWLDGIDRDAPFSYHTDLSPEQIVGRVRNAGIVGLGGAAFPTHVKIVPPPGKKAECLILNGAECEPFLTSDDRLMREFPREILAGAGFLMKALGVSICYVGIEDNKPEAIAALREAASAMVCIKVVKLKKKYPQGGEKQLINAILRRSVPSGGLPIDVGAVVQNVGTAFAVYEAVAKNKPLIDNVLTYTGLGIREPENLRVRVGTPLRSLIDAAGGLPQGDVKVISGGPMMGKAVANLDATTLKATASVLVMTASETLREEEGDCIRCGKCADACPMGLKPYLLNTLSRRGGMQAGLEEAHICDCIECGCCLYTCPAHIPLLDIIRVSKAEVMKIIRSRKK